MRPLPFRRDRSGFSLIEMIVVVAILIILLALLTPTLTHALERARLAQCSANLRAIQAAVMQLAEDNDGIIVPLDIRPWNLQEPYQATRLGSWAHRWSSTLMKEGYLPLVPFSDDPDVMPPRGTSVFRCPSGTYEYVGEASSSWDPVGKGAERVAYTHDTAVHGPSSASTSVTYVYYPVWYGTNGASFFVGRHYTARNPGDTGGNKTPTYILDTAMRSPSSLITFLDGRFTHNSQQHAFSRVNARHMRSTVTNCAFADGHVAAFRTDELPGVNNSDANLYPSFRR